MNHPSRILAIALAAPAGLACGAPADEAGGQRSRTEYTPPGERPNLDPPPDDPACDGLTDYPGDCFAMTAPPPEEGYMAHYGPRDYDDPDEIASFVIEPGAEYVDCTYSVLDNPDTLYFQDYTVASRPGMHHVILYAGTDGAATDGLRDECNARDAGARLLGVLHGGIGGGVYRYPPSGQVAPENEGLASMLTPEQVVVFELHAVNPLDEPVLIESWAAFHAMDPDAVTELTGQIVFNGGLGMQVPPQTTQVIENECPGPPETVRLVEMFGHMHAHGARFSAFKVSPDEGAPEGESRTLIYESYDWFELDRREYNSVVQHPVPAYRSGVPGAYSGVVEFGPEDRIDYECEIQNTEDYTLTYSLGAYTAEMCNLFGAYAPDYGSVWQCMGQ